MQGGEIQFGKSFPGLGWTAGLALLTVLSLLACNSDAHKSDTELGLNDQQAAGRRVYEAYCGNCHAAYSRGSNGPSLQKIFKRPYLRLSGLPANDDRITDIVRLGRGTMPGFGQALTSQQLRDLLAYLHTL